MKRLLDCTASDVRTMTKQDLLAAIAASEGRTLACETIGAVDPLLSDVTNAELAASLGADLLLLNLFDVDHPQIRGLPPCPPEETIRQVKRLTGRPVGIDLEPAEAGAGSATAWAMTPGRRATVENAQRAADMGADLLLLTGNPGTGVTNRAIEDALSLLRARLGDRLILAAGKMHGSGVLGEDPLLSQEGIRRFAQAGADVLLFPAPGTVPGVTMELVRDAVSCAHRLGRLAMTSVGTSQEGADRDTIRQIALLCKMTGTDIHHLGDSGYTGVSIPEDITAYSVAIRGVRHTYRRMAASILR